MAADARLAQEWLNVLFEGAGDYSRPHQRTGREQQY
jgi:hypothetical protein